MARQLNYLHSRFDGGMTDSPRDTSDLTKLAYISHLDIYRDHTRMFVMPGYESINGFDGNETGIKTHDIRAFTTAADERVILAVGTKADGSGSKVFQWNESTPDTEWSVKTGTVEGAENLLARPFYVVEGGFDLYPVNNASNLAIGKNGASTYTTITPSPGEAVETSYYTAERGFDGKRYVVNNSFNAVKEVTATTFTNAKTTGGTAWDIASADYTIGIAQTRINPTRGGVLVWDAASLLADQNVRIPSARPQVVGALRGAWVVVTEQGLVTNFSTSASGNGRSVIATHLVTGESTTHYWEINGFSAAQYTENNLFPIKGDYDGSILFHLRLAQNSAKTEYVSGVYAVGGTRTDSQIGVSQLLNTSSLGVVENVYNSGRRFYFAHGLDGSISRLQRFDTSTYDVPAEIQTLIYGAQSPYLKEVKGTTIVTENLPSGASVECFYRTDEDDAWVSMGVSNETNSQKHTFTQRSDGTPIGRFQEVQFRFVLTGKITVKNLMVRLVETESLAY